MKKISKEPGEVPKAHQDLVFERLEKTAKNSARLLDWNKFSNDLISNKQKRGFDARKFNGKLKVNEDALAIQKRLRDEWN